MASNVQEQISTLINKSINKLPSHLLDWAKSHICEPHKVNLSLDPDGVEYKDFWLITDHTGNMDSSYRVVFDEGSNKFGLECTLENGIEWYMGAYGTFNNAIEKM